MWARWSATAGSRGAAWTGPPAASPAPSASAPTGGSSAASAIGPVGWPSPAAEAPPAATSAVFGLRSVICVGVRVCCKTVVRVSRKS